MVGWKDGEFKGWLRDMASHQKDRPLRTKNKDLSLFRQECSVFRLVQNYFPSGDFVRKVTHSDCRFLMAPEHVVPTRLVQNCYTQNTERLAKKLVARKCTRYKADNRWTQTLTPGTKCAVILLSLDVFSLSFSSIIRYSLLLDEPSSHRIVS